MQIDIVGAGLAGLIAGNMLAHRNVQLSEMQDKLPNNHSAVLRFRSPIVGDVTGIPFRKVRMIKTALPWRNPVADALAYSLKGGTMRSDRSITSGLVVEDRYIAPSNLIYLLANQYAVRSGKHISFNELYTKWIKDRDYPCVSTIPMPMLMGLLGYDKQPSFTYQHGINIRAHLANCDAYVSILIPDPKLPFTRVSITGSELIVELPRRPENMEAWILSAAVEILGIDTKLVQGAETVQQRYAKIMPIDDDARRNFIHWATDEHGVYSLGRFAIWKPELLLDDLVNDVRRIERWIGADKYSLAQAR